MPRTVEELIQVDDPAWPEIMELVESGNPVRVLPNEAGAGRRALYRLQMTARSMLGGVVLSCAAMIVDHGWIKVLGSGLPGLPDPASASGFPAEPGDEPFAAPGLLVAIDALGGQFAIDGGGLGASPGEVCYWGPDSLRWTGMAGGYSAFVTWLTTGDRAGFYDEVRWPGWEADAEGLGAAEGFSLFPFPWTKEHDPATASRTVVPLGELCRLSYETAEQIGPERPLPWPAGF